MGGKKKKETVEEVVVPKKSVPVIRENWYASAIGNYNLPRVVTIIYIIISMITYLYMNNTIV